MAAQGGREAESFMENLEVLKNRAISVLGLKGDDGVAKVTWVVSDIFELLEGRDDPASRLEGARALMCIKEKALAGPDADYGASLREMIVASYRNDDAPEIRGIVVDSLAEAAAALHERGEWEEALGEYDSIIEANEDDRNPEVCASVAVAMLRKAALLGDMKMLMRQRSIYEEVEKKYGDLVHPAVRFQVAQAVYLRNYWVAANCGRGGLLEFVVAVDAFMDRYSGEDGPGIRSLLASAKCDRLRALLGFMGFHWDDRSGKPVAVGEVTVRPGEIEETYGALQRDFGESKDPRVRQSLAGLMVEYARHCDAQDGVTVLKELKTRYAGDVGKSMASVLSKAEALLAKHRGKLRERREYEVMDTVARVAGLLLALMGLLVVFNSGVELLTTSPWSAYYLALGLGGLCQIVQGIGLLDVDWLWPDWLFHLDPRGIFQAVLAGGASLPFAISAFFMLAHGALGRNAEIVSPGVVERMAVAFIIFAPGMALLALGGAALRGWLSGRRS